MTYALRHQRLQQWPSFDSRNTFDSSRRKCDMEHSVSHLSLHFSKEDETLFCQTIQVLEMIAYGTFKVMTTQYPWPEQNCKNFIPKSLCPLFLVFYAPVTFLYTNLPNNLSDLQLADSQWLKLTRVPSWNLISASMDMVAISHEGSSREYHQTKQEQVSLFPQNVSSSSHLFFYFHPLLQFFCFWDEGGIGHIDRES